MLNDLRLPMEAGYGDTAVTKPAFLAAKTTSHRTRRCVELLESWNPGTEILANNHARIKSLVFTQGELL